MTARSGDCAAVLIPLHSTTPHHARAEDPRMDGPLPLLQPETRIKIPSPSRVGSSLARVACLLSVELYSGYWYARANQSTVS